MSSVKKHDKPTHEKHQAYLLEKQQANNIQMLQERMLKKEDNIDEFQKRKMKMEDFLQGEPGSDLIFSKESRKFNRVFTF